MISNTMDSRPAAAAIVVLTVLSYGVGWVLGVPALVPFLNTLASVPFMVAALARGGLRLAVARMLVWAASMAVCATFLSYVQPWRTESLFLGAAAYRTEMFAWVFTGRGAESTPSQFVPQHAMHAAAFSSLALATGGVLAMPMGAVLMNQMGHYVGALAAASAHPVRTLAIGWHPWSLIRIASFVTIGVVLSAPLWERIGKFRVDRPDARRVLALAAAGLILDVALKWLLAPAWQRLLLGSLG